MRSTGAFYTHGLPEHDIHRSLVLDWQQSPFWVTPLLTVAIAQLLPITYSKMNEDGQCVTTRLVYIYFNRYGGEEAEAKEDK